MDNISSELSEHPVMDPDIAPIPPVEVAADENERIRVWNYEEATLLNGFDNHDFPDKGISKLCLINELDDSLLLVASCDGSVRIWKNYATKGKQKLVTGFSSIQGQKPGARDLNAVVDWQQQSGYLVFHKSMSIDVYPYSDSHMDISNQTLNTHSEETSNQTSNTLISIWI